MASFRLRSIVIDPVGADSGAHLAAQNEAPFRRLVPLVRIAILAIADVFALMFSGTAGYFLWAYLVLDQKPGIYQALAPMLFMFMLIYAAAGLYPGFGLGAVETLKRLTYGSSFGFLLLAAASFTFKLEPAYSRIAFVIAWVASLMLVPLVRFGTLSIVSRCQWWGELAVFIGPAEQAGIVIRLTSEAKSLGYRVVGRIASIQAADSMAEAGALASVADDLRPLPQNAATAIVWAGGAIAGNFDRLHRSFHRVIVIGGDATMPVEHVRVRNLGSVIGIEYTNELLRPGNRLLKRILDVIFGAVMLALSLPIIALCGLAIKLASPGPIFFRQQREGLDGRIITLWKLRTMHRDAETRLNDHLAGNEALRREWETHVKLAEDPRIIPAVGTLLRRFSLDELPQLLNVVRGEMSLVGPRPFPEYHLRRFSEDFRELRCAVRPGLSGMWQVAARSAGGLDDQQHYDTYYIRNWSVWLDIYILARTVFAVIASRGAY